MDQLEEERVRREQEEMFERSQGGIGKPSIVPKNKVVNNIFGDSSMDDSRLHDRSQLHDHSN